MTRAALVAAALIVGCAHHIADEPAPRVGAKPIRCRNDNDLHVASTGSDTTGTGTDCRPWATLDHARAQVSARGLPGVYTVNVDIDTDLWGTATTFAPADSGSSSHPITYRTTGAARILGGQPVTGWTLYSGSIYRATLTATFQTLYENHVRATMARTPNLGGTSSEPLSAIALPSARDNYLRSEGVDASYTILQYKAADAAALAPGSWTDPTHVQLFVWSGGFSDWFTDTHTITGINTGSRQLTIGDGGAKFPMYNSGHAGFGSRYWVQGDLTMLDQSGEWYLDTRAGCASEGGKTCLYYWPRATPITSQEIVYPTTQDVLSFAGTDSSHLVHDITVTATVEYSDAPPWYRHAYCCTNGSGEGHTRSDYDYEYSNPTARHGLVHLENTSAITFTGSTLRNAGLACYYARLYAQGDVIQHGVVKQCGAQGVFFEGNYPGEGDVNRGNTVTDNWIHDTGQLVGNGSGIMMAQSGHNTISYNEIYNVPRDAITYSGWGCGAGFDNALTCSSADQATIYAVSNVINHNLMHSGMQDSGDAGVARSSFLMNSSGSAPFVTSTWTNDIVDGAVPSPSMANISPNGLYNDNETFGQVFTNFEILQTRGGQIAAGTGSGAHTLTNTSFNQDGTTNGSFDHTLMDAANIGTLSSNPFAVSEPFIFADSFENGLGAWLEKTGSETTSTAQAHSGTHSFIQTNTMALYQIENHRMHQTVGVWFYDVASVTDTYAYFRADEFNSNTNSAILAANIYGGPGWRAISVEPATSTTHYSIDTNNLGFDSGIARTTGWHHFLMDYTAKDHVSYYIDGTFIRQDTGTIMFNKVAFGNVASSGGTGTFYWDDFAIN